MDIQTDVVVVGAGPTGLTAAALLADQGLRVTLVDKAAGTSDQPRAISATDETLRVMAQLGVLDSLRSEMLLDTGARYFGRRGQLLAEVRPGSPRLGHPGKSQFDQPLMEEQLLAAVRRRPVDVRFETEAFGVTPGSDGVDLVLVNDAGKHVVRASYVLACDGGRSPIRNQLGIAMEGSTQVESWIVIDLVNTGEHERFAEFHCNGTRPAVVVPGVKGRCRFEFMLLPGDDPATITSPGSVIDLVEPHLHRRIEPADVRRARVYVAHQRVALQWSQGRVLLAGDAAHMMPPFAGQGLNAGIRDAANAAWKIAAAVKGEATPALLTTYQQERKPHASEMVRLSARIGSVVMSTDGRVTAARDLGIKAAGIVPSVKSWLAGMKFLRQPHFTEGCVVAPATTLPRAAAGLVGRALPQPTATGAGRRAGLDTFLGAGWTLLRIDGRAIEVLCMGESAPTYVEADSDWLDFGRAVAVIVRPDRYVAAVTDVGQENSALAELARFVPGLLPAYAAGPIPSSPHPEGVSP